MTTSLYVVTITCRQNPRLDVALRTLLASYQRAQAISPVHLTWVIVDELDRSLQTLLGEEVVRVGDTDTFGAIVIPPPSSPHRQGTDRLPAHNIARNKGLGVAFSGIAGPAPDYIVMLNDCNVVTQDWVTVAVDCAKQGVGWKCKTHQVSDMAIPEDGIVRMKDHHDRLRPVPVLTVAGPCWGAPASAFGEIQGFDVAYDGQKKGNDVDAIVRMSRTGLTFIATERAFTVQLKRTKIDAEVTTSKEAHAGKRNQELLNQLMRDKKRILPRAIGAALPAATHASWSDFNRPDPAPPAQMVGEGVFLRRTGAPKPDAGPAPARAARPADDAAAVTPSTANGAGDHDELDEYDDLGGLQ